MYALARLGNVLFLRRFCLCDKNKRLLPSQPSNGSLVRIAASHSRVVCHLDPYKTCSNSLMSGMAK
jgi:hypothetical protein